MSSTSSGRRGRELALPALLYGHPEPRFGGVGAPVGCRAANDRATDSEAGAGLRLAQGAKRTVDVVLGGHPVSDANSLRTARGAHPLVDGTANRGPRKVELQAGKGDRARPGVCTAPIGRPVGDVLDRAAAAGVRVDSGASGDGECLTSYDGRRRVTAEALGPADLDLDRSFPEHGKRAAVRRQESTGPAKPLRCSPPRGNAVFPSGRLPLPVRGMSGDDV